MKMLEKEITFDRFIRGLIFVIGLGLAIYLLNILSSVLLPFFIAWLFAYMLYPLVKIFQYKLKFKSRVLSIVMALLLVVSIFTGALFLIIPPTISEFMKLQEVTINFIHENTGNPQISKSLEYYFSQYIEQNSVIKLLHEKNVMEAAKLIINQLWNVVYQTVDFIIGITTSFIVLLYMFFILMDYESISQGWIKFVPQKSRPFISMLVNDVEKGMNSYFRGQALVALLVGILFSIGFSIIDFPLAIGLGLFIGFLNLVPYLQLIGFIPTLILALIKAANTGENFWVILLSALAVFAVVQLIQDAYLTPKIMGKLMGLNPAIILLSLSIWGSLLGMIGFIIALPLTTLIASYYKRYIIQDNGNPPDEDGFYSSEKPKEGVPADNKIMHPSPQTIETENTPDASIQA